VRSFALHPGVVRTDLLESYGIPLPGIPLGERRELLQAAERLGYTDAWSEDNGLADTFSMLALAAALCAALVPRVGGPFTTR
jgi:alkanesulfonate monooxygenase SsuD/methylene tetrahydromethanopterin reductase-like flavin-dependent oxidoreductase (luciferase family)